MKFFRWAVERLEERDGIVCFVTNNSFVDQIAFDGMRKNLLQDFTKIYHADLHGNVRENPKLSGTTHNVFGIQVGVGITVAIRKAQHANRVLLYHRVPEDWRKEEKLSWLEKKQSVAAVEWQALWPDENYTWLIPTDADEFATFLPIGTRETKSQRGLDAQAIFKSFSLGVATNRDQWVYDFSEETLALKLERFIKNYNYEIFRLSQESSIPARLDDFVNNDPKFLKWTDRLKAALRAERTLRYDGSQIRRALYRPFTRMSLYFDGLFESPTVSATLLFPYIHD